MDQFHIVFRIECTGARISAVADKDRAIGALTTRLRLLMSVGPGKSE